MSEAEVRRRIVSAAGRLIGSHYLKGTYGHQPPGANNSITRMVATSAPPRNVTFMTNRSFRDLAVRAAQLDRFLGAAPLRCCGRFREYTGSGWAQEQYRQRAGPGSGFERAAGVHRSFYVWFSSQAALGPNQPTPACHSARIGSMELFPRRQHIHPGFRTVLRRLPEDEHYVYFGENCDRKQHFDCIGFAAYVLTEVKGSPVYPGDVKEAHQRARWAAELAGGADQGHDTYTNCQPGDLFLSDSHVAIVSQVAGETISLIHPYGEQWGVKLTQFCRADGTWSDGFTVINLSRQFLGV